MMNSSTPTQPNKDPGPLYEMVNIGSRWGDAAFQALIVAVGIILAIAVILQMAKLA